MKKMIFFFLIFIQKDMYSSFNDLNKNSIFATATERAFLRGQLALLREQRISPNNSEQTTRRQSSQRDMIRCRIFHILRYHYFYRQPYQA